MSLLLGLRRRGVSSDVGVVRGAVFSSGVVVGVGRRHCWICRISPLNWLVAIEPTSYAVAAVMIGQWGDFFHANIRLSLGPLTPMITGPQYQRFHHSIESKHLNKNYAAFFTVWDWVFGTYWRPVRREWPAAGLRDTDGIPSLREIFFSPFVGWWRSFGRQS